MCFRMSFPTRMNRIDQLLALGKLYIQHSQTSAHLHQQMVEKIHRKLQANFKVPQTHSIKHSN